MKLHTGFESLPTWQTQFIRVLAGTIAYGRTILYTLSGNGLAHLMIEGTPYDKLKSVTSRCFGQGSYITIRRVSLENLGDRFIGDLSYVIGHPWVLDIDHGCR